MKRSQLLIILLEVGGFFRLGLPAQELPQFTDIRLLANHEVGLTLQGSPGLNYRIEAAVNPVAWQNLATLPTNSATLLQYTDSAAPYLSARFYRAQVLRGSNIFTGDHLVTTNGDVVIQPRYHASLVMSWNGLMIYIDPADPATFTGLAKADVILVTHSHTDHFGTAKIDSVRGANALIVAPQDVYNQLTTAQKAIATVLNYGAVTNILGLTVEAVPAYNSYHPIHFGNGYVLTIGGKRIYISGDTGNISEMHQLTNIAVAFLCMNQPWTMTATEATNAVAAFRPGVVYPYHYRDQNGATANASAFKQLLSRDLGVEVRLRKWY